MLGSRLSVVGAESGEKKEVQGSLVSYSIWLLNPKIEQRLRKSSKALNHQFVKVIVEAQGCGGQVFQKSMLAGRDRCCILLQSLRYDRLIEREQRKRWRNEASNPWHIRLRGEWEIRDSTVFIEIDSSIKEFGLMNLIKKKKKSVIWSLTDIFHLVYLAIYRYIADISLDIGQKWKLEKKLTCHIV